MSNLDDAPVAQITKKVIIINGPPRSGKDLGAVAIQHFIRKHAPWLSPTLEKFSLNMQKGVHATYGLFHSPEDFNVGNLRNIPNSDLLGMTPQQVYDAQLEHLRQCHGIDVLGVLMEQHLRRQFRIGCHIFSDAERLDDVIPIIEYVRPRNVLLLEIFSAGKTFEGSGGYYGPKLAEDYAGKVTQYTLPNVISPNPDDKALFRALCIGAAKKFLKIEVEDE